MPAALVRIPVFGYFMPVMSLATKINTSGDAALRAARRHAPHSWGIAFKGGRGGKKPRRAARPTIQAVEAVLRALALSAAP